ncbi:MAG: sulfite exporter TauE/SafE family protein [Bacteroidetes bacterium]|nr:sulfite exporter TauE/SafE family protein [Bacteroidota bacterium]
MPDILSITVLTCVGVVAGFINVNAGGGSTLTLPVLIFLGLDTSAANGTNRIAILLQNVAAVQSFKQENFFDLKTSLKLSFFTLPGSVAGALLAVRLEDELFKVILGIIMIGIIISMILPKKKSNNKDEPNKPNTGIYLPMIGIGFYGGFIQVGVGFLLMASLQFLMKLDLVRVNMYKVFIVLIYTIPALLIFALTDNVNWLLGIFLAIGNILGGWWGAKMQIKKGEGLIKYVLIIAVFIIALKLLDVF